jgi:hypothetical protein
MKEKTNLKLTLIDLSKNYGFYFIYKSINFNHFKYFILIILPTSMIYIYLKKNIIFKKLNVID